MTDRWGVRRLCTADKPRPCKPMDSLLIFAHSLISEVNLDASVLLLCLWVTLRVPRLNRCYRAELKWNSITKDKILLYWWTRRIYSTPTYILFTLALSMKCSVLSFHWSTNLRECSSANKAELSNSLTSEILVWMISALTLLFHIHINIYTMYDNWL